MSGCVVWAVAAFVALGVISVPDVITVPTSISKGDLFLGLVVVGLLLLTSDTTSNDRCNDSCPCRRAH